MKVLTAAALLSLIALITPAKGQVANAWYNAWIVAPDGQFDSGFLNVPVFGSWGYSDVDQFGNSRSFDADVMTAGGQSPQADVQAAVTGGFTSALALHAQVRYLYHVSAVAGSTRTAVPVVIRARGDVSATRTGSGAGASVSAVAKVFMPGASSLNPFIHEGASAGLSGGGDITQDSFSIVHSTVLPVGQSGLVEIVAHATLSTDCEISATADPTFLIDPDATYIENGKTFRYIDEFVIEYSPTIDQFVPCSPDITGDGQLDFFDISMFLTDRVDYNNDTVFDFFDIASFLTEFSGGCP